MKVVIENTTYTQIRSLSFDPETDPSGSQVPVNEFVVEIYTEDQISTGVYAELYDDRNQLWARYWIVSALHATPETVRVHAQSELMILDRFTLSASLMGGITFENLIEAVFMGLPGVYDYSVSAELQNKTISGYFPEQTARERIQWACFVAGAYIKTYFGSGIRFLSVSETETIIPAEKTFWRPSISYKDYVTAIKVKAYSYTAGTPTQMDEWVQDGPEGDYYIQSEQTFSLANTGLPANTPTNEVIVKGITIISPGNVSEVMEHLAQYYFKQKELELDAINNADYIPGQKVKAYTDPETMASGYIKSCSFTFGLQARSRILLTNVGESVSTAKLIIRYMYNSLQIEKKTYNLPAGYEYEITNPYLNARINKHYYVFRPLNATATGTVVAGGTTDTEECEIALDLYKGVLHIISVDSVTVEESGSGEDLVRTAVIA